MATSGMDKALYQAPLGLDMEDDVAPIEIEIENPDEVSIGIGGLEIDLKPRKETAEDFDVNLAEYMDESDLDSLGSQLVEEFGKDIMDRKEWMQTYVEGLKLLGLR
jgi:hypothetical protein